MVDREQLQTVNVNIGGQQYGILHEPAGVEHIQAVARYVDEKLREVGKKGQTASLNRLAILTALNIAEEFFTFAKEQRKLREESIKKVEDLIKKLESQIAQQKQ